MPCLTGHIPYWWHLSLYTIQCIFHPMRPSPTVDQRSEVFTAQQRRFPQPTCWGFRCAQISQTDQLRRRSEDIQLHIISAALRLELRLSRYKIISNFFVLHIWKCLLARSESDRSPTPYLNNNWPDCCTCRRLPTTTVWKHCKIIWKMLDDRGGPLCRFCPSEFCLLFCAPWNFLKFFYLRPTFNMQMR